MGILAAGAVPFIESYVGSALGVIIGLPPVVAIAAACVGNFTAVALVVLIAASARDRVTRDRAPREQSPRRARLRRAFDKWGVPGVSLIGQSILPSQLTSAALVSFGAPRGRVLLWQAISIVLWGIGFGVLASLGITAIAHA